MPAGRFAHEGSVALARVSRPRGRQDKLQEIKLADEMHLKAAICEAPAASELTSRPHPHRRCPRAALLSPSVRRAR